MSAKWSAEWVTYAERKFPLALDIREDDYHHRATIYRSESGEVVLKLYASERDVEIPAEWLRDMLRDAAEQLPTEAPQKLED